MTSKFSSDGIARSHEDLPEEDMGSLLSSVSDETMAEISDRSFREMGGLDIQPQYGQETPRNQQHPIYGHQQQNDHPQRQNRGLWVQ